MFDDLEVELFSHVETLAKEIGPRPIGTAANHAAADYIVSLFAHAGLSVEQQSFPCPDWHVEEVTLQWNGQTVTAAASPFSPSVQTTAPLAHVSTLAELQMADLKGQIVLLTGDLSKEGYGTLKHPAYLPEHHKEIVELLIEKRPQAVLTLSPDTTHTPILEDWSLPLPSATVLAEDALCLLQQIGASVHLTIKSQTKPGQSANIIGRKGDPHQPRLLCCAHYDTKFGTPGAFDNGSGVAVLLALARLLPQLHLPVGLEFVAFSGEEYGFGDDTYLDAYELKMVRVGEPRPQTPSPFQLIHAAINIDGVGQRLGNNTVTAFNTSETLDTLLQQTGQLFPALVPVEGWPASNHYTFYSQGVPTIAFSNVGGPPLLHQPHDTPRWLSPAKLKEVCLFITQLTQALTSQERI